MRIDKIDLGETGMFSPIFLDYINKHPSLKEFYGEFPKIENFERQIEKKELSPERRELLHKVLIEQYEGLDLPDNLKSNITSLRDTKTYTVTTGHQLNIFSGPLYFVFKIISTINLAKKLKEQYPDKNFIPVYWMATEDHDFDEINHFTLFGNTHTWETDQTGAVGRFNTETFTDVIKGIPEDTGLFARAYEGSTNLTEATRCYVHELFADQGLVIIDGDNAKLKASFSDIIQDDILNHRANDLVVKTSSKLTEAGYKTQVFPRDINFFYMDEGIRSRIVKKDGMYKVLKTELNFTESEIISLIEKHPEKFSPNVIMRPLYEECILPNLAYVGGPGELAYWLQLKEMFEQYKVAFPVLMPRNFGMIVNKSTGRKISKLNLALSKLFLDKQQLKDDFLGELSGSQYELNLEKEQLSILYKSVREKAVALDKTLGGYVGAEESKAIKTIDHIEKRLKKSEEQKQEILIKQLISVKDNLFPDGGLQERKMNILNFSINNPAIYKELLAALDPFDIRFYALLEDE